MTLFAACYGTYFDFTRGAQVLEIGCAEADWLTPMKTARPDLHLTGIDWRGCKRPGADLLIRGDVLQQDFGPASFDAVVMVSALEHIGLGHYDADPLAAGGDSATMDRVQHWLRPGGGVYFDVPWNPDPGYEVYGTKCRIYDDASLSSRLMDGFTPCWRGWATTTEAGALIPRPTTTTGRFYYCANVWKKA